MISNTERCLYFAEGKGYSLETYGGMHTHAKTIPTLYSDQEETDSRVVLNRLQGCIIYLFNPHYMRKNI